MEEMKCRDKCQVDEGGGGSEVSELGGESEVTETEVESKY